jgi:hypothetical protein
MEERIYNRAGNRTTEQIVMTGRCSPVTHYHFSTVARVSAKSRLPLVIFVMLSSCAFLNAQENPPRIEPPRIEIGGVLSAATQSDIGNYFHVGGGGRVTVNVNRYFAGEVEATRQPTGSNLYSAPPEVHTVIAAKGTYRAEQQRWLKVAGLNFFGVVGPAFVNRTVTVGDPNPPPFCIRCTVLRRQTASMLEWGGGFEVVPARPVAVRFDVTHASFSEPAPFSSYTLDQRRTYIKVAVMLRLR